MLKTASTVRGLHKGHNYAGVRPEAEPAAIMQAAAALGTLISHELMGVVVTEKAELAQ